ncbi:hypothetical protein H5P33_02780 [Mycolicibacterium arabiense]|uniref:hypothetical protein n=1 Tax=Mycolicibacterium arabiense TaxID=1286181 RepID=UPI0021F254F6|nr:hypothetical protein [Mycolicibacterium arabiense]MCV7371639.1 hypothetical protein [Mycolicibacterium arabiense]
MKKSAITATIAAGFAAALFGLAAPANAGIDHAITATIAAGFAAALFGLAAPANAGIDHHSWLNDVQQQAVVGSATSTVGNGR